MSATLDKPPPSAPLSIRCTERIVVLHSEDETAVCLWIAVYEQAGRLFVYRELEETGLGPSSFAVRVQAMTPAEEKVRSGWCDPSLWASGGPAKVWQHNGLFCRRAWNSGAPDWSRLVDFLEPLELRGKDNKIETVPRLMALPDAPMAANVLSSFALSSEGPLSTYPVIAHTCLVACVSRREYFTRRTDPIEDAEEAEERWWRREFPRQATAERTVKRMGY